MRERPYPPSMPLVGPPGQQIGYTIYTHPKGAPPLFLLHGFTASSASFLTNLPALRERFTVVTVDLLGHGESEAPEDPEPYATGPAVERILDLMDELDFEQVLLCGHSLGGALALRVALDYPDRVAGLVIINSNSAAGSREWREQVQPQLAAMGARVRAEGTAFLRDTRLYPAKSQRLPADARAQLTRDFDRLTPAGVAGTAESLVAGVNAAERLGELKTPTLVVVGDKDPDFVHNAPRLVAAIRNANVKLITLAGAGHAANLEQPEAFHKALFDFASSIGFLKGKAATGGRNWKAYAIVGAVMVAGWAGIVFAGIQLFGGDDAPAGAAPPASSPVATVAGVRATPTAQATATQPPTTAVAAASPPPTNTAAPSATAAASATPTPAATSTNTPAATATATPRPATPTPTPAEPTPTPTPTEVPPTPTPTEVPPTPTPAGLHVTVSGPATAAVGQAVTFTAGFSGTFPSDTVYAWSAPGGQPPSRNATGTFTTTFNAAGCYAVTITAVYSGGQQSATARIAVGGVSC